VSQTAAASSSRTVAVLVDGSSAAATSVASHQVDACAPWAISLPRRILRSRRMTITCLTSSESTSPGLPSSMAES
jgi:hypothetical protein